jgi:hypothetical protein
MKVTGRMVLDVPLHEDDPSGASTIGGWLMALLRTCCQDGEEFSAKRPFGSSGWREGLYWALGNAGLIQVTRDSDGDIDSVNEKEAARLMKLAIAELGSRA